MTSPLRRPDPRGARDTARAIVLRQNGAPNELLVMERWRRDSTSDTMLHYFSIPGGGIEHDETKEQAVVREAWEETQIKISVDCLVAVAVLANGSRHYYFHCSYQSGEPVLLPSSDEALRSDEDNRFLPGWHSLSKVKTKLHPAYSKVLPLIDKIAAGETIQTPWKIIIDDV